MPIHLLRIENRWMLKGWFRIKRPLLAKKIRVQPLIEKKKINYEIKDNRNNF